MVRKVLNVDLERRNGFARFERVREVERAVRRVRTRGQEGFAGFTRFERKERGFVRSARSEWFQEVVRREMCAKGVPFEEIVAA